MAQNEFAEFIAYLIAADKWPLDLRNALGKASRYFDPIRASGFFTCALIAFLGFAPFVVASWSGLA